MSKELTDAQKLDILLGFSKEFSLKETEDPASYTMNCGGGYTLNLSIKAAWTFTFNDGVETTEYNIDSAKVPFTNAKDARKLHAKYENECKRVLAEKKGESEAVDETKEAWAEEAARQEEAKEKKRIIDQEQEEKNRLAREENERRLAEKEAMEGKEEATPEPPKKYESPKRDVQKPDSQPVNKPHAKSNLTDPTILKILETYIRNDLVQIFGDTGTGKTSISMQIANDARNEGRRVLYVDSEHNTTDEQASAVKANGIDYIYIPDFEEMYQYIRKIKPYDVVIVDSMGLPVLNLYATMGMRERGDALLKMIALTAFLKKYANQNKALIVVTNQPESDFNKDPNTARRPFGDKSQFNTKEIFRTVFAKNGRLENKTTIVLKAYRSRSCGMDSRICSVEISDNGVKVIQ